MKYALLILALAASPVFAAEKYSDGQATNYFNAGAACLPALPRYDTNVRKRPLAVVNEGNVGSYVTCNYIVNEYAYETSDGVERFDIVARNQSNVTANVVCTAVVGVDDGNALYLVQTAALAPGQRKKIEWKASAYGQANGWRGPVNMSCLLPPLTGLNEGRVHWDFRDRHV